MIGNTYFDYMLLCLFLLDAFKKLSDFFVIKILHHWSTPYPLCFATAMIKPGHLSHWQMLTDPPLEN